MKPNETSKITQIKDIIILNERKNKEFDKINKKRSYLEVNATCLLNPKSLIIGKHILIPYFAHKGKISQKIPVRILDNSSFGYYKIKICLNCKSKNAL